MDIVGLCVYRVLLLSLCRAARVSGFRHARALNEFVAYYGLRATPNEWRNQRRNHHPFEHVLQLANRILVWISCLLVFVVICSCLVNLSNAALRAFNERARHSTWGTKPLCIAWLTAVARIAHDTFRYYACDENDACTVALDQYRCSDHDIVSDIQRVIFEVLVVEHGRYHIVFSRASH